MGAVKTYILALILAGMQQPGEVITLTSHYECFNIQGVDCKQIVTVFNIESKRLVMIQDKAVTKFEYTAKPKVVDNNYILTSGSNTFIIDPVREEIVWRGVVIRYYP